MAQVFNEEALLLSLRGLPSAGRYVVAFSGGADSLALLAGLSALRARLGDVSLLAAHVDHGLQSESGDWARRCKALSADFGVPLYVLRPVLEVEAGEGLEAAARRARYGALSDLLESGDLLLTGHQQDDQAETVLLNLLRGAGPMGLRAMRRCRPLGRAWLARPLLGFERCALRVYLESRGLGWIEDPSNRDDRHGRNYLRHDVLPLMRARWPAVTRTLARAAEHQAAAADLLSAQAASDLGRSAGPTPDTLVVSRVLQLPQEGRANLLRHWLSLLGLPAPLSVHLAHIQHDVLSAPWDAEPLVRWYGAEVRRYRDLIYAMAPPSEHDPMRVLDWSPDCALVLGHGQLLARRVTGGGLRRALANGGLRVRFRRGGERCRPAGRPHTRPLKDLLQEAGIPPWHRQRLPLVYVGEELAAVADICVSDAFAAGPGEEGLVLEWQPHDAIGTPEQ